MEMLESKIAFLHPLLPEQCIHALFLDSVPEPPPWKGAAGF
jgi:hypothetical protein